MVQVYNQTRFVHQFTMGLDKEGREHLSFVFKGTWDFPDADGGTPGLAEEQWPLIEADIATGEPGYSATQWETDFAFRKPHPEVLAQGAAYAPKGQRAERVRVGVRVGNWVKQFDVVGHREWQVIGPVVRASRPVPFRRQPFGYDTAFGGPDRLDADSDTPAVYLPNPVGRGFGTARHQDRMSGLPLPVTEAPDAEVTSPFESYRPMSLGPMGRAWPDRAKYAGTYDQAYIDNIFPFLPPDFDDRYFQSAPADQWLKRLDPGAPVVLVNLTPNGREAFSLPDTRVPVTVFRRDKVCFEQNVTADTLILDPEARRFALVWRIDVRIRDNFLEFNELWLGSPTDAMRRARAQGKSYMRAVATGQIPQDEDA